MALQWREPQNTIKPAKTLGEILIQLALNYVSPLIYERLVNRIGFFERYRILLIMELRKE